jgi:hypothetical protein
VPNQRLRDKRDPPPDDGAPRDLRDVQALLKPVAAEALRAGLFAELLSYELPW